MAKGLQVGGEKIYDLGVNRELKEENHPIDFYFARRVAPQASDSVILFLANLLKGAREGHLCLPEPHNVTLPEYLFEEVLVKEEGRIYLRRNWDCEKRFIEHFHRLRKSVPREQISQIHLPESLQPQQKKAIHNAAKQALSLICGGPGTGKTFTAKCLIEAFLPFIQGKVVVTAPTGKATANLRKALKGLCRVETLHAFLQKRHFEGGLVLVDEASMIDAKLMATLFSAIKEGSRLVLIGDKDQLPPVESGNFFADLVEDKEIVTELEFCLRAERSEIVEMAEAVKKGRGIPTFPLPDLSFIVRAVLEKNICVLSPLRHGPFGVNWLNRHILKEHELREGKRFPIMITVNDAALDLYNGDLGELVPEDECAYFGERKIPLYLLPHYEYAYVLSVHKSQGSEYDAVMVLLPEGSEVFGREMLYTAVTRAKRSVEVYGSDEVVAKIISKKEKRYSGL